MNPFNESFRMPFFTDLSLIFQDERGCKGLALLPLISFDEVQSCQFAMVSRSTWPIRQEVNSHGNGKSTTIPEGSIEVGWSRVFTGLIFSIWVCARIMEQVSVPLFNSPSPHLWDAIRAGSEWSFPPNNFVVSKDRPQAWSKSDIEKHHVKVIPSYRKVKI